MNNILEDAAARLSVDVDALVAGGLARGRRLRRRRRVLGGTGSLAVVATLAVGSVWAVQAFGSRAALPAADGPSVSSSPIPPKAAGESHTLYVGGTDATLALDADQIHAHLASMFSPGSVGPILRQDPYPVVSRGTDRIEHFTYNGSLVSFLISAAAGQETCASIVANAGPAAGFGRCETVGDATVLTEQTYGAFALNSVIGWRHGYEISILSYAAGPSDQTNPAMDGKRMKQVADQPPLSLDMLKAAVESDAWFG